MGDYAEEPEPGAPACQAPALENGETGSGNPESANTAPGPGPAALPPPARADSAGYCAGGAGGGDSPLLRPSSVVVKALRARSSLVRLGGLRRLPSGPDGPGPGRSGPLLRFRGGEWTPIRAPSGGDDETRSLGGGSELLHGHASKQQAAVTPPLVPGLAEAPPPLQAALADGRPAGNGPSSPRRDLAWDEEAAAAAARIPILSEQVIFLMPQWSVQSGSTGLYSPGGSG